MSPKPLYHIFRNTSIFDSISPEKKFLKTNTRMISWFKKHTWIWIKYLSNIVFYRLLFAFIYSNILKTLRCYFRSSLSQTQPYNLGNAVFIFYNNQTLKIIL